MAIQTKVPCFLGGHIDNGRGTGRIPRLCTAMLGEDDLLTGLDVVVIQQKILQTYKVRLGQQ